MSETKPRVKIGASTVKVSMEPLYAFLTQVELAGKQLSTIVKSSEFIALMTAQRGGGSTEDNWLTVEGNKVARACAMLGVWFPHNNDDKAVSHFYKNGSYHIVVEKLKNLKVKAHKLATDAHLQKLEDDMMASVITPLEWQAQKNEALKEFKFEISDETKAHLVTLTKGYETKELLAEAMADENTDTNFTAIEDDVNKYLAEVEAQLFPTVEEPTDRGDVAPETERGDVAPETESGDVA